MHSISVFNNKGGVGKTTLTYHLAHALGALGHKVLLIDADPQCNLTIFALSNDAIEGIWNAEDELVDGGVDAYRTKHDKSDLKKLLSTTRTLHFCLMPTEDGTGEFPSLPPAHKLASNVDIVPGRLSLHNFEDKIAARWSDAFLGDSLALRTITRIRTLTEEYADKHHYDYVIVDTSPSLGILNKSIISTVDAFFVPAAPDLFSLYGIRNIGRSLNRWHTEFTTMKSLLSEQKKKLFPEKFVSFIGYTIYNAKRYETGSTKWHLAKAHQLYADRLPAEIKSSIPKHLRVDLSDDILAAPIGGTAVMHGHNTYPSLAQYYHVPIWRVPLQKTLLADHDTTVHGNKARFVSTEAAYKQFAADLLGRVAGA
jgi:cellulose biosynthesis protein BcsQ